MAALDFSPIQFPWEMALQARQEKTKNMQDMWKNIQGMGQGLGQIGQDIGDYEQKKRFRAAINKLIQQSQAAPPQTAGVGGAGPTMAPQPQANPMMAQVAPFMTQQNVGQILPAMIKASAKPQGMTPYQQASIGMQQKRLAAIQDISKFRESMMQTIASLKAKGLNLQAKKLQTQLQAWEAQHWFLSALGEGPTANEVTTDEGGGDISSMSTEELQAIANGK